MNEKWEYQMLYAVTEMEFMNRINQLGQDGWEAVTLFVTSTLYYSLLKRRISN